MQNKIRRRDSVIQNMVDCRCTLESRIVRLREERDRCIEETIELLAVKANLKEMLHSYSASQERLKERAAELKKEVTLRLSEAEALKKRNEAMTVEIEVLKNENEVQRVEVSLTLVLCICSIQLCHLYVD